jgi:RNA polymerase sigma-70 factor (ECF subfamily)
LVDSWNAKFPDYTLRSRLDPKYRQSRRPPAKELGTRARKAASLAARLNLRAWLFAILHNQHVNEVRHSLRQGSLGPVEEAESVWRVEPVADASLQLRDLQRAINTLCHEQREVLLLVGLEGMRYEPVATILDIPVGTVRSRLSRARTTLRLLMDGAKTANDRWSERCDDLAA